MNHQEAVFEAPAAHEIGHEASLEDELSHEFEWEQHEASHHEHPEAQPFAHEASQEWEYEWETGEANPYSNPEGEADPFLGGVLGALGSAIGLESEDEWEIGEANPYSNPEGEADQFFGRKLFGAIRKVASMAAPIAKRLAPFAAKTIAGMIPGVGPLAGKLMGMALRKGEFEVAALEANLFNPEVAYETSHETAHEAALTELLAAEAVQAESEAEAEAVLASTLPITITIMGGRRALRPVMPALAQANGRLVRVLRRQGSAGRQLLRTVPAIQRRAVATMRVLGRRGQPITGPVAVRALAAATNSVLGNPRQVQRAIERNALVRQRVAPPNPRRAAVYQPSRVTPPNPRRTVGY
jgi:hypothetical protein